MRRLAAVLVLCAVAGAVAYGQGRGDSQRGSTVPERSRIYNIEELTWPQIDAFNRERTLFILPAGILEEHGPHLPVGADTLAVTYEASGASRRVSQRLPDWNIVMMPPLNYGSSGANVLGGMFVHPGTYGIRQSTLRSIVADIGGQIAQNGFKWIFVLNGHGSPAQGIAINEACDFISDTFSVTMLHLTGLFKADAAIQAQGKSVDGRHFSPSELASFGMDVHAGVSETSGLLAVRPDLVRSRYKTLPSRVGRSHSDLREIASTPGWQGYFSSPARAHARYGRAIEAWWVEGFADLMVRAVRGEDLRAHPRIPDALPADPSVREVFEHSLDNDRAFEQQLQNWLARGRKD